DATDPYPLDNCFVGNVNYLTGEPTSDPASIQSPSVLGQCGIPGEGDNGALVNQIACDAYEICPDGGNYPRPTAPILIGIPADLPSMPDPCQGVPANPWCRGLGDSPLWP